MPPGSSRPQPSQPRVIAVNDDAITGATVQHVRQGDSPKLRGLRGRMQVSLTSLMLLTVIFSIIAAALLYASRVPVVQDELSVLTGGRIEESGQPNRTAHLLFILFTLVAPLLTAGVLATGINVLRMGRRR